MISIIKKLGKSSFDLFSKKAIYASVKSNKEHLEMWDRSKDIFNSLHDHFTGGHVDDETEYRIRFLISAEAAYVKSEIKKIISMKNKCSYLDVGDSDGSVRILIERSMNDESVKTMGVNLQKAAVEKIRAKGMDALHMDAMDLGRTGVTYDVVSLFETLEHLPNPIGFLEQIHTVVGQNLIVSVPFVPRSRVSLKYLEDKSTANDYTIENVHIFELSRPDWKKIFSHTGWRVEGEWVLLQFPKFGILRLIMQTYWRKTSFEGFWFVTLTEDDKFKKLYKIESHEDRTR